MESHIEKILAKLEYPVPAADIESAFSALISPGRSKEELDQIFRASQEAHRTNFTFMCSHLHERAPALLLEEAKVMKTPVSLETVLSLRDGLMERLKLEAAPYFPLSPENLSQLKIAELATEQVRCSLLDISPGDNLTGLITAKKVQEVYQDCAEAFLDKTQVELLALGDYVSRIIENHYDGLMPMDRVPSAFLLKFLRKLARVHLESQLQEAQVLFHQEVQSCQPGHAMDWDLQTDSVKGQLLSMLATLAYSLEPDSTLAGISLGRVISQQFPSSQITLTAHIRYEAFIRLYMGLINLANPQEMSTEPEMYLWMRRVLKSLFGYPKESPYYENKLLNVLNQCAASYLKEKHALSENLRYALPGELLRSFSWQSADLNWAFESMKFRFLSREPSLSLMLHVQSPGDTEIDPWTDTEEWQLARAVLQWKLTEPTRAEPLSNSTTSIMTVPLALLAHWLMVLPIAARGIVEFVQSKREDRELSLRRAQDIGVFLGLLLAHRKLNNRFISLLGHGVGAQVVVACLAELAEFNRQVPEERRMYVLDVVLMLAAIDVEEVDWNLVQEAVKGRFINLYSSRDDELAKAFGPIMARPAGCSGIGRDFVQDADMADVLESQAQGKKEDARSKLRQLLKLLDYCP